MAACASRPPHGRGVCAPLGVGLWRGGAPTRRGDRGVGAGEPHTRGALLGANATGPSLPHPTGPAAPPPLRPARARTPRTCSEETPTQRPGSRVSGSPWAGLAALLLAPAGTAPKEAAALLRLPGGRGHHPPRTFFHCSSGKRPPFTPGAQRALSLRQPAPSPAPSLPPGTSSILKPLPSAAGAAIPPPVSPLLTGVSPPIRSKSERCTRRRCINLRVSPLPPPRVCHPLLISKHKAKTMGVIGGWKILNQREMYGLDDLWITRVPWHEKYKNIYSP